MTGKRDIEKVYASVGFEVSSAAGRDHVGQTILLADLRAVLRVTLALLLTLTGHSL